MLDHNTPTTDSRINKRTFIKSGLAIGLGGGILGLSTITTTQPAAAVSVSGFQVEERVITLSPGEEITDLVLVTNLSYEYSVSHSIDRVDFTVSIDNGDGDWTVLATESISDPPTEDTSSISVSESIVESDEFSISSFSVDSGGTISVPASVKVVMELVRNNEVVGVADAQDDGSVAVTKEELRVSAQLGGGSTFEESVTTG